MERLVFHTEFKKGNNFLLEFFKGGFDGIQEFSVSFSGNKDIIRIHSVNCNGGDSIHLVRVHPLVPYLTFN